jgi:hypothetical protein
VTCISMPLPSLLPESMSPQICSHITADNSPSGVASFVQQLDGGIALGDLIIVVSLNTKDAKLDRKVISNAFGSLHSFIRQPITQ